MGYSLKHSSPLCPCGWLNPHMQRSQIQGAWGQTLKELEHLWSLVSAGSPGTNLPMEAERQLYNYKGLRIWLYLFNGVGICCLPFLIHSHFAWYQVPQLFSNKSPLFSESVQGFQAELPPSLWLSECKCDFSLPNHELFTIVIIS